MQQPVLVIHGVGNRGHADKFKNRVEAFGARYKGRLQLIDLYWGDLAAEGGYIEPTLPNVENVNDVEVRGREVAPLNSYLGLLLLDQGAVNGGESGMAEVRGDDIDRADIVADAAAADIEGRGEASVSPGEVREAVRKHWPQLTWLSRVNDEEVLREAGRLVGEITAESEVGNRSGGHEVRGASEVRGPREFVGEILKRVDDFAGKLIGRAGGNLNRSLRKTYAPKFAGFFGDIIAYSHHQAEVHQLIRDRIDEVTPGAGASADRPVGAIAHSLGGVILFDMAVANENPLHIKNFVTFGSQAPFFHAIADRSNKLDEFKGTPVTVPSTLRGKWINLWEPLDLLAFVAAKVFCLAEEPHEPDDRMVHYARESGLWTHSSYWDLPELVGAVDDAFSIEGG